MAKFLGSVIASIVVGILGPLLIQETIYPYYSISRDSFSQTFDGGFAMGLSIIIFGLIQSDKSIGEITLSELYPCVWGVLGMTIVPLFVLGILSVISGDLVNWLFEFAGGFTLGTLSVGLVLGAYLWKIDEKIF